MKNLALILAFALGVWVPCNAQIGGSGTTNQVAKFTASTTLGNSGITDNGTTVSTGEAVSVAGKNLSLVVGTNPNLTHFVWNNDYSTVGKTDSTANTNEYGLGVALKMTPSGSTVNFQKVALFADCQFDDTTATSGNRDCAGVQGYGEIASGVTNARIWGGTFLANLDSGEDGLATGAEFDVSNSGTDQPLVDQPNSKYGISVISMGSVNSTAAISINGIAGQTAKWHRGILVRNIVSGGDALNIPNNVFITARIALNSADLAIVLVDASNRMWLGQQATDIVLPVGIADDGQGFKHRRFGATCATGASAGSNCTTTYTWTTAFGDASYTPMCWGEGPTNAPILSLSTTQAPGSITVRVTAATAAAASFAGVDCVAVHD